MIRLFRSPYSGAILDFESMPQHSSTNNRPGRWCPVTGFPLDDVALANLDLVAMQSVEARTTLYNMCKAAVDAVKASFESRTGINALNAFVNRAEPAEETADAKKK